MNDKQIKAMAESANLLFDNKISRNFFYELLLKSFEVHEWMGDKFGLNEKNNYRVSIPIPDDDTSKKDSFWRFAEEICKIKSEKYDSRWTVVDKAFVQDAKKNKYKITRLLNPSLWKLLVNTVHGKKMFHDSGKVNCCDKCTLGRTEAEAEKFVVEFNVWYGEQVKSNTLIVLSCHPVDILQASENASFQSCYRIRGEWFNGVIASMLSPNTLISSIEQTSKPGYKIGRSWIYVNEDMIVAARKYGSITDTHHLHIRSFLYSKMGGKWSHFPKVVIGDSYVKMEGPGYLDRGHGTISLRKNAKQENVLIRPVIIPAAMCLYCGRDHNNNGSGGVCRSCQETVKPEDIGI